MDQKHKKLYLNLIKHLHGDLKDLRVSWIDKLEDDHFTKSRVQISFIHGSNNLRRADWIIWDSTLGLKQYIGANWIPFPRSALLVIMYGSEDAALLAKLSS